MPEQLTEVFSVGCKTLNKARQGSYAKLLVMDQGVFCKDEMNLGVTDVTEMIKSKLCPPLQLYNQFQLEGPDIPPMPLWKKRKNGTDLS